MIDFQKILDHEATLQAAIDRWGKPFQFDMAMEECTELIQSILHERRGRATPNKIAEEVADVTIMMRQLRLILGPDKVDTYISDKMKRLNQRVLDHDRKIKG